MSLPTTSRWTRPMNSTIYNYSRWAARFVLMGMLAIADYLLAPSKLHRGRFLRIGHSLVSVGVRDQFALVWASLRGDLPPIPTWRGAHFIRLMPLALMRAEIRQCIRRFLGRTPAGRTNLVTMEPYGQLALEVHAGLLYFDVLRRITTKVVSSGDAIHATREIENARKGASLGLAPEVVTSSVDDRMYQTRLIIGNHPGKPACGESFRYWQMYILPLYFQLVETGDVCMRPLDEYLSGLLVRFRQSVAPWKDLLPDSFSDKMHFVEEQANSIRDMNFPSVVTHFSHGDLNLNNVMVAAKSSGESDHDLFLLDWESAQEASLTFDLFDFFFREFYHSRVSAVQLEELLTDAVEMALPVLADKHASFKPSGFQRQAYEKLYYLERTVRYLETRSQDAWTAGYIERWCCLFEAYESVS